MYCIYIYIRYELGSGSNQQHQVSQTLPDQAHSTLFSPNLQAVLSNPKQASAQTSVANGVKDTTLPPLLLGLPEPEIFKELHLIKNPERTPRQMDRVMWNMPEN